LTLAGFPPGASLRSCVSDSIRLFRVRFSVGGHSPRQRDIGLWHCCLLAPRFPLRPSTFTTLTDSPRQLIIEFREFELRHAGTLNSPSLRGSRR
ncbi:hypothetical protein FGD71_022680, partial [Streptomyces sporangiiformans]